MRWLLALALLISQAQAADYQPGTGAPRGGQSGGIAVPAGSVGEVIQASVVVGSAVVLSNNTPANMTSISLSPGDWDVRALCGFVTGSGSTTVLQCGFNTTSNTLPAADGPDNNAGVITAAQNASGTPVIGIGPYRVNVSATTTLYVVAYCTFATSCSIYGGITARRVD